MAQMLLSRVKKSIKYISSLLLLWVISGMGYAQTTLLPGDLVIVTINSAEFEIEIVPLIDLEPQTEFELRSTGDSNNVLKVTLLEQVASGNSFLISSIGSGILQVEGELILNKDADQITVYQLDVGINRILFSASWGVQGTNTMLSYGIPFVQLGEGENHQYHLKNGASGTHAMIKEMVADPSNWKTSNEIFPRLRTSFRVLESPVILFDQNVNTVIEGDSIPLSVAIYGHDGSRLTVDVVFNEGFSTADSNDVSRFKEYTYNFTGLIGDAVYEISVPLDDDNVFEGRETAYFELKNLSAGNFGDFVSHAAFIRDNEIPDVSITSYAKTESRELEFIEIQNNERVYLNIAGWQMRINTSEFLLDNVLELAPFERRRLTRSDFIFDEENSEVLFSGGNEILSFIDLLGNEVISTRVEAGQQVVRSEFSEVNIDLPGSSDFDANPSVSNQPGVLENSRERAKASEKEVAKPGWYPMSSNELEGEEYRAFFWNESSATFEKVSVEHMDSLSGISLFRYLDFQSRDVELEPFQEDTTFVSMVTEPSVTDWIVTLSATDLDGNGILNDSEGYNFIQYNGFDSVSVDYFITSLEDELGERFLYPGIFSVVENKPPVLKDGFQKLFPGEFLWVKADSVFGRKELTLSPGMIANEPYISNEIVESISNFRISLNTDSSYSFLDFNFFEGEGQLPYSVIEPLLDLQLLLNELDRPVFGGYYINNWNSALNLGYPEEVLYSFPLGILHKESGELSITIDDWNMEGGWRLFIQDQITRERTELFSGIGFDFEYTPENRINDLSEDITDELTTYEVFSRYSLILASPDYVESAFDFPEQIELNQNYPNPFNPETTISFYLPESADIKLSVFNVVGQPISVLEEGFLTAGEHQYLWNASGYPSGMYIYQLEIGNKVMTRKMTLVK